MLFLRQRVYKLIRPPNPIGQLLIRLDAIRLHQHPALHRSAGDVKLSDVFFLQSVLVAFRTDSEDQRILPDPDAHVTVEKEADAAKHFLLGDAKAANDLANTKGKRLTERHVVNRLEV